MGLTRGSLARGSLTLPRMNAHLLVIIAAALTTVVAAALATALATFSGQALPRAVRHDLGHATGTTMVITGNVDAGQAAQYNSILPARIRSALGGTAFGFYSSQWSDPLGFVPGSRPARPASAGNQPIVEAAELGGITSHAALVSGRWPAGAASGQPVPAALPATAAALLHVSVGDVLRMRDRITQGYVRFVITGLYRPVQVSSSYWGLDNVTPAGSSTASGFTTYGPLTVQAAAFAGPLAVYAGTWLAQPHTADIPAGQLTTVAASVDGLRQQLLSATQLPTLTLTTSLPAVLDGTASDLDVARSLLAICAMLLFLLAAAPLLAAARLLAGQREGESAMLAARGATRWQLVRMTAAEAIPLCLLASVVGGVVGVLLARVMAAAGAGDQTGPAGDTWPALGGAAVIAALVAIGAIVIMLVPALSTVTPGTARARRGRQAAVSRVTRAGADLALVLLAVLAGWQLRHYSAVSAGANGNFGVDPVVVIAPALALAGGTVVALRLLPAGGKAGDRLAARGRRLTAALASWQISRQPIRQGGAALLIVLSVATGTLALAQRQSWIRSDHDQAAFSTGADVRVQTSQPLSAAQAAALVRLPGVRQAMPVAAFPQEATDSQTLAIGADQAADVTLIRADQSAIPAAGLFGMIRRTGPPPGVTLPGHPAEVQLTARLGPASLGLAPVIVNVSVADADSDVYQLDAGTLPADGREHTLTVTLANQASGAGETAAGGAAGVSEAGGTAAGDAVYPLRVIAISLDYTLPAARTPEPATFSLDGVSGGPGTARLPGSVLGDWRASASSAEQAGVRQDIGTVGPSGPPAVTGQAVRGTALAVTLSPGYGLAASGVQGVPPSPVGGELALTGTPPVAVLPGLATQRFLAASNTKVGSIVQTNINGAIISVRIAAAVATFPTASGGGGALVVDLGRVQDL
jgi:FtsX-like permease family protein